VKAHSLIGRIDIGLMRDAFKAVKRNRGAAGVDKVSIQMFGANLMDNLHALMRELKSGSYEPCLCAGSIFLRIETKLSFAASASPW